MENYELMDYRLFTFRSEFDKAVHTLEGLLMGITADKKINATEIKELSTWCSLHRKFNSKSPYKELIEVILDAISDGVFTQAEKDDVLWVCNNLKSKSVYYDLIDSNIQRLQGLLHGILADNVITEDELNGLKTWLNDNEHLASTYPYDEVYSLVISVLSDKKIDEEEQNLLKVFFSEFSNSQHSNTIDFNELNNLRKEININGICSVCPEIAIKDKCFCFTGVSSKTTRVKIKNIVEVLNGTFVDSVNKSTDYLVVGNNGNPCWAFSCYGRKVEKAMELRKTGHPILIVHEHDFWDAVEDLTTS